MKRSEIYLRAAKAVHKRDGYSCVAIDDAVSSRACDTDERRAYASLFELGAIFENTPNSHELEVARDRKQRRVLLLCLASAISAAEGN